MQQLHMQFSNLLKEFSTIKDLVANLDYNLSLKANKVRQDELEEKLEDFVLTADFIKMSSDINNKIDD